MRIEKLAALATAATVEHRGRTAYVRVRVSPKKTVYVPVAEIVVGMEVAGQLEMVALRDVPAAAPTAVGKI